jgi:nucleoside-diphosphate-sugar epimerase
MLNQGAILVTGGSGFIGRNLVSKFSQNSTPVVCMYHFRLPEPMANVYPVCSDLGSPDLLAAPLRGVETVYHLAWENNFVGPSQPLDSPDRSNTTNLNMLRNLLIAMERAGTKRLVFTSALGARKDATEAFLKEKYFAEFLILNSNIEEKIIIRPTIVCGHSRDRFLRSIVSVMNFPVFYPVPMKQESIAPLHVDDLIEILIKLSDFETRFSHCVAEIVGKDSFRIEDLFRLVSTRFSSGRKFQIRGAVGETLFPFFERDKSPNKVKLRHLLTLSDDVNSCISNKNPLAEIVPKEKKSFVDVLAERISL